MGTGGGDGEARFRSIFRRAHAEHPGCLDDEWLTATCRIGTGEPAARPVVWSRRNGPWRQVDVLFVGAAPGNAGGMGGGTMGAHATRIPFGGDIAGANLDALLSAAGLDRNTTFIVAALNQLPDRGGGEPSVAELRRPVGDIPSSLHLLRETMLAAGPRLLVALGNVAMRSTIAAARLAESRRLTLPGVKRLEAAGLERGISSDWPAGFPADAPFTDAWSTAWAGRALPRLLWLLHPSAQNMSPHAGADTVFHSRMVQTRDALVRAVRPLNGSGRAEERGGIYDLPEWRSAIGPRHSELRRLWRAKGL